MYSQLTWGRLMFIDDDVQHRVCMLQPAEVWSEKNRTVHIYYLMSLTVKGVV